MAAESNSKDPKTVSIEEVGKEHLIAVATPLMKRVLYTMSQSEDIIFCDSTGNVDENKCRFFQLLIQSQFGGLPVGVLITTSKSEKVLTACY